jgi:hypothetical protein
VGWRRTGLLDPIYAKLAAEGHSDARDELARRTGIKATNLSQINTGKRDMTDNYARRIADVVPGVSPADLGSDEGSGAAKALLLLDRLAALEAALQKERSDRDLERVALAARLDQLEAALTKEEPGQSPPTRATEEG